MARPRIILESTARILALALCAWLLADALWPRTAAEVRGVRVSSWTTGVPAWLRDPRLTDADLRVDATPSSEQLALLRAARRSGLGVTWNGDVPALALSAERVPDPQPATVVRLASSGAAVELSDALGPIDSVRGGRAGSLLQVPSSEGAVSVRAGAFTAVAPSPSQLTIRAVLVLGAAGWEAKFVVAALEERGWTVATRLAVAPGVDVTQHAEWPLDTSRFAAVVALDTTASRQAGAIARFARQGGGVVLTAAAARAPALASLAPASGGRHVPPRVVLAADSMGPGALPMTVLLPMAGAATVAQRSDGPTAVARRIGRSRIVETGLEETWRWRMEGPDGADAAHRAWWAGLVAAAAYVPPNSDTAATTVGIPAAPRVAILDALGAASAAPSGGGTSGPATRLILLAATCLLLLVEWGSRRLRGAP